MRIPPKIPILLLVIVMGVLVVAWLRRTGGQEAVAVPRAAAAQADARPAELGTTPLPQRQGESGVQTQTVAPAAQGAEDPKLGTLILHAVSKETRAPLAMVRVLVFPKPSFEPSTVSGAPGEGSVDMKLLMPITAAEGIVEVEVPPRIDFALWVYMEDGGAGSANVDVVALGPGERRELTVELLTGCDVHYFGRLIAKADGHPVAGGRVQADVDWAPRTPTSLSAIPDHLGPSALLSSVSDATGQFELRFPSWRQTSIRIHADGFSDALLKIGPDHDTPEKAKVVPLSRAAAIHARILDGSDVSVPDTSVRVITESYYIGIADADEMFLPSPRRAHWDSAPGTPGICVLEGLPPDVPLNIEICRAGSVVRRGLPPLSLLPGEVREVEWRLGVGCLVEGRVIDQSGAAVSSHPIWMQRADSDAPSVFQSEEGGAATLRTKTDAAGRFSFSEVGAGKWWIGPAATRGDWDPPDPRAIAPFAPVVEIQEGATRQQVELRVQRGLYIGGKAITSAGAPAARATVFASLGVGGRSFMTQTQEDGSFALGPLVPGNYQLLAQPAAEDAASEEVEASAGQQGIVLRLRSAGRLSGTVVDAASGQGVEAGISYALRDRGEQGWTGASTTKSGAFAASNLAAGTYDLAACGAAGGVCILRGVVVQAGVETSSLVLKLSPGARVRFRLDGREGSVFCRMSSAGVTIAGDQVRSGQAYETSVPAGDVLVQVCEQGRWSVVQRLDIAVGEVKEVVFSRN